jgi:spore coat protein CotH
LTVDGVKFPNVGVHFRGMSSYMAVPAGYKRSLNLSVDFADAKQRLYGYKTLNLLNSHEDPSCLSTVLYSHIARQYIPAPQANLVKVVINGESWGIYVNVQQFNKEFLAENYPSTKGSRWKVRGSPGGGGGLDYVGDNIDDYRRRYEIKSDDNDKAWRKLVALCRTLSETPAEELPAAIEPILDIDSTLWFLALDVTLINNDGYWVRASDYSIYLDPNGQFHIIPHDMNEAFHGPMGPSFGPPGAGPPSDHGNAGQPEANSERPPRGMGMELDPLIGLDDPRKPLRSKLLAIPDYRQRYLQHVRALAAEELDWATLGPVVASFKSLIDDELRKDTRKLESYEAFLRVTANELTAGQGRETPLRFFADRRRAYLLDHPEIKKVAP